MKDFDSKKNEQRKTESAEGYEDQELQQIHGQLMRENPEPQEMMNPMPMFFLIFLGILVFWAGFYLAKYSCDFRGDIFDPEWRPMAQVSMQKEFDPIARGKKLFAQVCQQCHQADGHGLAGVYPPLVGSDWLLTSEERPVSILVHGLQGPVTVHGGSYNGNMPAQADWKDRDIAAVLTYVRSQWGNSAGPISEELVAKVRKDTEGQKKPWTGEELLKKYPL